MQLISFGDFIDKGIYKPHSKFKNVVNFFNQNSFISICNQSLTYGPFNIVLSNADLQNIDYVQITNSHIITNNFSIKINNKTLWSSVYIFTNIDSTSVLKNINTIIKTLKNLINPNSLLFVQENKTNYLKGFDKAVYDSLQKGINLLLKEGFEKGIPLIKGKGKGLTPSGDDFICGYLYALFIYEKLSNTSTKELRNRVYEMSRSNNLIVDFQLKAACNAWFNSSFFPVLDFLLKNNKEHNIKQILKPILSQGASSGEDILSGFLLSLFFLLKQNN